MAAILSISKSTKSIFLESAYFDPSCIAPMNIIISYVIVNGEKNYKKGWKKNFSDLSIGLEIFNMFDIQNSITNTWVRDVYSKRQYSIPNYLTPRLLNLTIDMKL
jgi:hypothetical protein